MRYGILLLDLGAPYGDSPDIIRAFVEETMLQPDLMPAPQPVFRVRAKAASIPAKTRRWTKSLDEQNGHEAASRAQNLAKAVQASLGLSSSKSARVVTGLAFGEPNVESALAELCEQECDVLVRVPVYPIDFEPLTGLCLRRADDAMKSLARTGWQPRVKDVRAFGSAPGVARAYAGACTDGWEPKSTSRLLVLFPSVAKTAGCREAYLKQIDKFMEGFDKAAGLRGERLKAAFTCDFDNEKWVGPFAEKTLRGWGSGAVNDVRVVCPMSVLEGPEFSSDVAEDLKRYFLANANGMEPRFKAVSGVSSRANFVDALCAAIRKDL